MLEVESLTVRHVLDGIDLRVGAGELVAVVGPAGAGKSALLAAIAGTLVPDAGRLRLDGRSLDAMSTAARTGLGIVYLPQGRSLFPRLTVADHLRLWRDLAPQAASDETVYARLPALAAARDTPAGRLGPGLGRLLALARALLAPSRLLLADEPCLGLDPPEIEAVFALLSDVRASGVAVLVAEQHARRALAAADRGYALADGRVRVAGAGRALAADPAVARVVLGAAELEAASDPRRR